MTCRGALLLTIFFCTNIFAQSTRAVKGDLPYVVTTGVPFMRIAADARSSGMGEAGVATAADNNCGFHNPAKFAFVEKDQGINFNFAPWLREITNDIYLINVSGYSKISANHTAAASIRYFTLGQINYTDQLGGPLGSSKPFEMTLEGFYAFRLAEHLSIGAGGRFIYSNLSNNSSATAPQIPAGTAFAVDFSMFYSRPLEIRGLREGTKLNFGVNISNIGSKIQYTTAGQQDYIPTNLALGAAFEAKFDEHNSLTSTFQIDKLLVPNPTYTTDVNGDRILLDANRNGIADFREYSSIAGIPISFGDNGDGIGGELKEMILHGGFEYGYDNIYFARAGVFFEPDAAGGRQFATLGLGVKYNAMRVDFSYVLPITQNRSPLDNQLRVSLGFNIGDKKASNYY